MLLFLCDYAIFYAPIMPLYAHIYAPNYADYAQIMQIMLKLCQLCQNMQFMLNYAIIHINLHIMTVTYYFTYKSSLHTILHTNDDYAKLCYFMLNYAPYAKLCSAMLLLCKLCLMLGLCDYAKKQCWHNRAPPTSHRVDGSIESTRRRGAFDSIAPLRRVDCLYADSILLQIESIDCSYRLGRLDLEFIQRV